MAIAALRVSGACEALRSGWVRLRGAARAGGGLAARGVGAGASARSSAMARDWARECMSKAEAPASPEVTVRSSLVTVTSWKKCKALANDRPPLASSPLRYPPIVSLTWARNSHRVGLIARKVGMMGLYEENGIRVAVTVLVVDRNHVIQVKEPAKSQRFGMWNIQVGAGFRRPYLVKKPQRFHCAKVGVETKETFMEFRVTPDALLPPATELGAEHFVAGQKVDVRGVTRGKGFQGVMKRHGFKGGPASHGSKFHRSTGSIGARKGNVHKGKKMPGRMGCDMRTVRNLRVVRIDPEKNLIYVKGQVPGALGNWVRVVDARFNRKVMMDTGPLPPFPTCLQLSPKIGDVPDTVPPPPYPVNTLTLRDTTEPRFPNLVPIRTENELHPTINMMDSVS